MRLYVLILIPAPRTIAPMGTYEIFIPGSDDTGGSGANFVISWKSDARVNAPMVEAVHANLPAGRAIAFIASARPIDTDQAGAGRRRIKPPAAGATTARPRRSRAWRASPARRHARGAASRCVCRAA